MEWKLTGGSLEARWRLTGVAHLCDILPILSPKSIPKWLQNGAKSGSGETVKTVFPFRQELTLALQAGCL